MGVLLTHTHVSKHKEITYHVEIHDTDYNGTPINFLIGGSGYKLRYEGGDDRFNPIVTSKVSLPIVVDNAQVDGALDNIINWSEGRFYVVIRRPSKILWVGYLLYEQFSRQNRPYPYIFNLTASDGLGVLETIDYDTEKAYVRDSLFNYIFDCLDRTKLPDFYSDTDTFLATSIDWTEANQIITASTDALQLTTLNRNAFYTTNAKDVTVYESCYTVLKEILITMGCRLMMSEGCYRIFTINSLANATVKELRYKKDRSLKGNTPNKSLNVTLGDINVKLGGGSFRYLSGLRKVILNYKHRASNNLAAGLRWSNIFGVTFNLGEIQYEENDTFLISMVLKWKSVYTGLALKRHIHKWRLLIQLGNEYLNRKININNKWVISGKPIEWSNTAAYYEIITPIQYESNEGSIKLNIETPSPTAIGDLLANFELVGTINKDETLFPANQSVVTWSVDDVVIELISDGETTNREDERAYEIENTEFPNNTQDKEFSTIIGDGVFRSSLGRLQVFDGTTYVDSNAWSTTGGNEGILIQELLIQEILLGRKKTIQLLESTMQSLFSAHEVIIYDSKRWVLMQGTFSSNIDKWSGTWFEIGKSSGGVTMLPPKNQEPTTPLIQINTGVRDLEQATNPVVIENTLKNLIEAIKNGTVESTIPAEEVIEVIPTTGPTIFSVGDTGRIINPNSGLSEIFEVLELLPDGNIRINETFENEYPEDSILVREIIPSETIVSTTDTVKLKSQVGQYTEVDFDLPTENIDDKLEIIRAGRRVFEGADWDYTIENNAAGLPRKIKWTIPLFTENLFIKLIT